MIPLWFSSWFDTSWFDTWYTSESFSRKTRLERRLRFLKSMRDELEPRLAGINAAIDKIEQQLSQEDVRT
jgi:hypothetical protein